jgi:hypothetical protein
MRDTPDRREDVMARYTGGMKVPGGYYLNARTWGVEVIPAEGGRLKDMEGARYVRVPFLALFVVVPVLGGLFLLALPFIGLGYLAAGLWRKAAALSHELASTVAPGGFAAGEAHFGGKPTGEKEEEKPREAPRSAELEAIEREIAARKGEGK